tara:strand:- start:103951 stop:104346 length:396 start_codon:yes stop_codon:yes gene_type:complete
VKHNLFKFTLRAEFDPAIAAGEQIESYVSRITRSLSFDQADLEDIYTIPIKGQENLALSYVKLLVRDYGVGQVGVDIVNGWMYRLFVGSLKSSLNVKIQAVVAHPLVYVATGALIEWDWEHNKPIIYELEL